jgi:hypothetical protein
MQIKRHFNIRGALQIAFIDQTVVQSQGPLTVCCSLSPASCTMGTGGKARPGRDADHSPPSSAEVENE